MMSTRVVLVVPPGAETAEISHDGHQFIPYREDGYWLFACRRRRRVTCAGIGVSGCSRGVPRDLRLAEAPLGAPPERHDVAARRLQDQPVVFRAPLAGAARGEVIVVVDVHLDPAQPAGEEDERDDGDEFEHFNLRRRMKGWRNSL